jgi:hypothetical protein
MAAVDADDVVRMELDGDHGDHGDQEATGAVGVLPVPPTARAAVHGSLTDTPDSDMPWVEKYRPSR